MQYLLTPPRDAIAYQTKIAEVAVEAEAITLGTNCDVHPLVIKVKTGVIKVRNTDSIEHVIAFEDENFFAVSAGGEREISTATLNKGPGIFRYRCGEQREGKNVGVLYIAP